MKKITYTHSNGWVAQWHGGAYIDLSWKGWCNDVINVWNSRLDKASIPFTKEALEKAVDEYMEETKESRHLYEEDAERSLARF